METDLAVCELPCEVWLLILFHVYEKGFDWCWEDIEYLPPFLTTVCKSWHCALTTLPLSSLPCLALTLACEDPPNLTEPLILFFREIWIPPIFRETIFTDRKLPLLNPNDDSILLPVAGRTSFGAGLTAIIDWLFEKKFINNKPFEGVCNHYIWPTSKAKLALDILDTADLTRNCFDDYGTDIRFLCKKAYCLMGVYAVTSRRSFHAIEFELSNEFYNRSVPVVLVANASDIVGLERKVSRADGLECARRHKWIYIETSAKTGHNVDLLFNLVMKLAYQQLHDKLDIF